MIKATIAKTPIKRIYLTISPLVPKDVYHPDVAEALENTERRLTPAVSDSGGIEIAPRIPSFSSSCMTRL